MQVRNQVFDTVTASLLPPPLNLCLCCCFGSCFHHCHCYYCTVCTVTQFLQLAGLTGTCATSRLRSSSSGRDASLPGPVPRPPGPLALIGPRQGHLWLVNSLGQPVLLPLTHPGRYILTCVGVVVGVCWWVCCCLLAQLLLLGH